jgi:hypothetical protein
LLRFSIVMQTRFPVSTTRGFGFGLKTGLIGGTVHDVLDSRKDLKPQENKKKKKKERVRDSA